MFFPIASIIFWNEFDTIIKKSETPHSGPRSQKFDLRREWNELSAEAWYKKGRSDICQGIETAQSYPREFQSRFRSREAKERARLHGFEMMLRSPPSLFRSASSSPLHYLSLPLSVFPRDWSANPVIHRKHRMQTVTWVVGSKVPRGRARGKRGRKTGICACVCMLWRQAVRCLYSCRSSSRYAEGGCWGFVILAPSATVRISTNSENRICYWNQNLKNIKQ